MRPLSAAESASHTLKKATNHCSASPIIASASALANGAADANRAQSTVAASSDRGPRNRTVQEGFLDKLWETRNIGGGRRCKPLIFNGVPKGSRFYPGNLDRHDCGQATTGGLTG